jgi:hypothetical protein
MGTVNDDEAKVKRAAPDAALRSDALADATAAGEGEQDGDRVEERQTAPLEEAGYGYGV